MCPPLALAIEQRQALEVARGRGCFNATAYRVAWEDLAAIGSDAELWQHYVLSGLPEGRSARCDGGSAARGRRQRSALASARWRLSAWPQARRLRHPQLCVPNYPDRAV